MAESGLRSLSRRDPYYEAWKEYARISRRALIGLLLIWVGGASSLLVIQILVPNRPAWIFPVTALPWIVYAVLVTRAPSRWPCPRCSRPFMGGRTGGKGSGSCAGCGLPEWAPRDPDAPVEAGD